MAPTSPSDDVRNFLRFWHLVTGEDAARSGEGGSEGEIARFRELVRFPLPPLYVDYLRLFGRRDPVVQVTDDASSDIRHLIALYEGPPEPAKTGIPPDGVLIGAEGISGGRSLIFEPAAGAAEKVAVTWAGDVDYFLARTFRNYLYSQAFVRGRIREDRPSSCLSHRGRRVLAEASRLAVELGFEPYWFGDEFQACFDRPDGTAVLILYRRDTLIYTTAEDETARDQLRDSFVQRLGFRAEWTR